MATSGSVNFSMTRDDIIRGALKKLGAFDASDSIPADEVEDAAFALNAITKELMAEGEIGLWVRQIITLFIQKGQESYTIGSGATDHATTSYNETTLSAAASDGATSITVTSATGFTVGYNIGVIVDDGSVHWTTISSVSGTTIGLTAALDDDAASGNNVYVYQTRASFFQRPIECDTLNDSGIDTPCDIVAYKDYDEIPQKDYEGMPTMVSWQPNLGVGTLFVWPTGGSDGVNKITLTVDRTIEDFDVTSDNPDFPIQWGNVLIWLLAADLAPDYGLSIQDRQFLRAEAERKKEKALQYGQDTGPVSFGIDTQGR
jgi:hypothetical protein